MQDLIHGTAFLGLSYGLNVSGRGQLDGRGKVGLKRRRSLLYSFARLWRWCRLWGGLGCILPFWLPSLSFRL